MLDKELEHIDGLSTFNTDNMAELEDILQYCQMGRDCSKTVMDEYTACDKISKEVIVWYSHNKKVLKQMKDWSDIYKDEFLEYEKKVKEVQNRVKKLKKNVSKS
jgi:DNA-binding Lrp family transcriptional regulator|tara:strand:- start:830 stop:1141 length:312 start_codon:yes stop_codon:yes gene_type:complete